MPRKAAELSALHVRRLTTPGLHFVGGATGLALQVSGNGVRTWILRYTILGKRRDMGLGAYPEVELADARARARVARSLLADGKDPIKERQEARQKLVAEIRARKSFDECAREFIESKSAEWRNTKHSSQWTNTLRTYASPVVGALAVSEIELRHVKQVLQPIWTTKTETATRVRARIEAVLDWATVNDHRAGANPARWSGNLDKVLPAPSRVAQVRHHKALPYKSLPAFYARLREQPGQGALALRFAILTAARSGEVRGATWREIDTQANEWRIPADRMKAGREHRVPLSQPALELLKSISSNDADDLVFSAAEGKALSDMTLSAVLRRMKVNAVPHGFRSTFRDWASEETHHSREVVEMSLAHAIESAVEAAYRRGDLFDKRRILMSDWSTFCESS